MLKEHNKVLRRIMVFFDWWVITAAFLLAYVVRNVYRGGVEPLSQYLWLLPICVVAWSFSLHYLGLYKSFRIKDPAEALYIIFKTAFFTLLLVAGLMYLFKVQEVSRGFVALTFLITTALLSIEKIALIMAFRAFRKKGYNTRNILIVGTNKRARNFIRLLGLHAEWGLKVLGFVDEDPAMVGKELDGLKVIGSFPDMPQIIHNNVVDEVVFVVPRSWLDKIQDLVYLCETEGIKANLAVDFFELKFAKAKQADLYGFPLLSFESTPDKLWHLLVKRVFDFIASAIGLLALSVPFLIIAVIIKLTSPGPVFFRQERSGINGRRFMLYKFRTMYEGAQERLKELLEKNEMKGPVFKMKDDPRINPLGKFMRKFSIDELPQLWNVFKGDMSLVGPRPPLPSEVNQYDNWHRRRLSMRPGITCLWQTSGRNKITDFDQWMNLDLEYIDSWSLLLDVKILLKTIPVVLFGIGAK